MKVKVPAFVEKVLNRQIELTMKHLQQSDFTLSSSCVAQQMNTFFKFMQVASKLATLTTRTQTITHELPMGSLSCAHCGRRLSGIYRLIAHLYAFHRALPFEHRFFYYSEQTQLVLEIVSVPVKPPSLPPQINHSTADLQDSQNLLNLFEQILLLLTANRLTHSTKDHQTLKLEESVNQIITTKRFYHGPARNFSPITTVEEFLHNSDDDLEPNFELANERKSLQKEIRQQPQDKQYFWTLWNTVIMELKQKKRYTVLNHQDILAALDEVLRRVGDQKEKYHIAIVEHLATLLTYQSITPKEFSDIIERL